MPSARRAALAAPLALAALALTALPAAARPAGTVVPDRAGDAPDPQLDLRKAVFAFERGSGTVAGSGTLAAQPTSATVDSIWLYPGRYSVRLDATCQSNENIVIAIPDAADVEAGLPLPYTELFPPGRDPDPIGFLPGSDDGATIRFASFEAQRPVLDALRSRRWNCLAGVDTVAAGSFRTGDSIGVQPLVAGPRPSCRASTARPRRGTALAIRCRHVRGRLTVRIYAPDSDRWQTSTARLRHGRVAVPLRGLRGSRRVSLWKGDVVVGRFDVRIR